NLATPPFAGDRPFWFCNIMQYLPVAPDRTTYRSWSYPAPFAAEFSWLDKAARPITHLFRRAIYRHYFARGGGEDIAVCEHLQEVLPQIERPPLLGALEQRIGWFEGSLRE